MASYVASRTQEEFFPDLHHKMSKKIAQLTKVIYHLNNKTEDSEAGLSELADAYENEIGSILQDAAKKINFFKRQIETKNEMRATAEVVETLTKAHEAEKKQAQADFAAFKRQAKELEEASRREAAGKMAAMTREVADAKAAFAARAKEFEEAKRQLMNGTREAKESSSQVRALEKELAEERARVEVKERELADAVVKSNREYNDMLHTKLVEVDALKGQLQARDEEVGRLGRELEDSRKGMASAMLTEQSKADRAERARQEAVEEAHKAEADLKSQFAEAQGNLMAKVKALNAEVERLQLEQQSLQGGDKERREALDKALREKQAIEAEAAQAERERERLEKESADNRRSLDELTAAVSAAKAWKEKALGDLASREGKLAEQDRTIQALGAEGEKARAELARLRGEKDAADAERAKVAAMLESTKGSAEFLSKNEAALKKELMEVKGAMIKAQKGHELEVAALRKELGSAGKAEVEDVRRALEGELRKAKDERAQAEASMAGAHKKAEAELELRVAEHSANLKAMEKRLAAEVECSFKLEASLNDEKFKAQELQTALTAAREEAEALQRALADERAKLQETERAREGTSADLEGRLRLAQEAHAREAEELKAKADAAAAHATTVEAKLAESEHARGEDVARLDGEKQALVRETERLSRALELAESGAKDGKERASKRLTEEIQGLNKEWERKMAMALREAEVALQSRHADELRAVQGDLEGKGRNAVVSLEKRMVAERGQFEAQLKKEAAEAAKRAEAIRKECDEDLDAMAGRHGREITEAREQHTEELLKLREERDAGLDAAMKEREKSERATRERHEAELKKVMDAHQIEVDSLLSSKQDGLQAMQAEWTLRLEHTVAEWTAKMQSEAARAQADLVDRLAALRGELEASAADALGAERRARSEEVAGLDKAIAALKGDVSSRDARIGELEGLHAAISAELATTQASLDDKCAELRDTVERMSQEREEAVASVKQEAGNEMQALEQEKMNEARSLNDEFERVLREQTVKANEFQTKCEALDKAFRNRESRAEDVERIRFLEDALEQRQREVAKVATEQDLYRKELVRQQSQGASFGALGSAGLGAMSVGIPGVPTVPGTRRPGMSVAGGKGGIGGWGVAKNTLRASNALRPGSSGGPAGAGPRR